MCGGGRAPKPQPMLPQAPVAPDVGASQADSVNKKKQRQTAGGTILTSSQGVTNGAATSEKTLLGS